MKRLIAKVKKTANFKRIANNIDDFINECKRSHKFDVQQMREISFGFENGLTTEEIKVLADSKFDASQMRKDLKSGLSIEKVKEKYDL